MRHYMMITVAACMLAALASSASAWYFIDDGHVFPPEGYANETTFTWWIKVQVAYQEEPPVVLLGIYDGGMGYPYGWPEMYVTELPGNICYYWWQSPLYYTIRGWGFMFYVAPNHWTQGQVGPIVYE